MQALRSDAVCCLEPCASARGIELAGAVVGGVEYRCMADAQTEGRDEEKLSFTERGLAAEGAGKFREAAAWYRRGWKEAHDVNAGALWANCLAGGCGVPRDGRAAYRVGQELLAAGCAFGDFIVGEALRTGKGAPMNTEESRACFRRVLAATEDPVEGGVAESLRCFYRSLAMSVDESAAEQRPALLRRAAELELLPDVYSLMVVAALELPQTAARKTEIQTWLRRAAERGELHLPVAELLAEGQEAQQPVPASRLQELALKLELLAKNNVLSGLSLSLLCRMWTDLWRREDELSAEACAEAGVKAGQTLSRLMQVARFGVSGIEPAQPPGLDAYLCWPYGPLMSYAWVHQPEPLQDMAVAEQGYRSDVAAYLRVTNESRESLSHFHIRVCDIAHGAEFETDVDDVTLPPGEAADLSLCMRDLTYSESMYIEVTSGPYRAELDLENVDVQSLLDYPAPSPAELCWETGFWGSPVLRVFNPGTEPLRVSLSSVGGVPCWCPKTVKPQEEVSFGWWDMMNLRMPAREESAVLHTAGYGDMSLRISVSERDDNIPGWRDWLDWLLGKG